MRLIDEIRNNHWDRIGPNLRKAFQDSAVIVADQVTEYYYNLNDQEYWDIEDFPNVAPPFKNFWIETVHPTGITSEEFGKLEWNLDKAGFYRPIRWGAQFSVADDKANFLVQCKKWGIEDKYSEWDLMQVKWFVTATMFVDYEVKGERVVVPQWSWGLLIKEDGEIYAKMDPEANSRITGLSFSVHPDVRALLDQGKHEEYRHHRQMSHGLMHPLFLTLTFLHCKNVELKTVRPDEKFRKRQAKRGRYVHTYKVLEVTPIKRMLEAVRQAGESGIKMALHRCRGHFKTYTAEKPLMGRAVGTYFWNEQVRGSVRHGQVHKDYDVNPKK